jgi:2-keto-3-deoxy-L-rhamnonate aldolase RhmA
MIETRAGLDAVDEILGTDGVDGVFVGPYDLALSLGHSSVLDEPVVAAVRSVVANARARGRIAGAFAGNPRLAAELSQVDLLGVDSDAAALQAGLRLLFGPPSPVDEAHVS